MLQPLPNIVGEMDVYVYIFHSEVVVGFKACPYEASEQGWWPWEIDEFLL